METASLTWLVHYCLSTGSDYRCVNAVDISACEKGVWCDHSSPVVCLSAYRLVLPLGTGLREGCAAMAAATGGDYMVRSWLQEDVAPILALFCLSVRTWGVRSRYAR